MMDSVCNNVIELISGAVDGVLSPEELSYFDHHIEDCEACRNEFELEKSTKDYFKEKVGILDPPADLLEMIRSRLSYEDALRTNRWYLPRSGSRRIFLPAMGIALILIITVITFFNKRPDKVISESSPKSSVTSEIRTMDALAISEQDFQNLLGGKLLPQLKVRDADDINEFIKKRAGYSIQLPAVRNPDWIGGSVTTSHGEKVVNVAYRVGTSYIYMYVFPTALAHSNAVSLPRECIKALDNNHWYWSRGSKGELQVTWMDNGRVCVATSNLDKKDLAAYLNAPEDNG